MTKTALLSFPAVALAIFAPISLKAQQLDAADTLIADGHYLRARPLVHAAVERSANDPHAIAQTSVLDWAFQRLDEAIATAEKAVSLAGSSADAHTQLTNALGAKLVSSNAGTMEKMSLARRFRKEADLSLQLNPNSADALEDAARFYWNAPGLVGGDKGKAQQLAAHLSQIDPARGAALKAGFLDDDKDDGRRNAAVEALWRAAVTSQPNSSDAHAGLSAALFKEGFAKYPQSEAEAKRAIALKPTRIAPYKQLAVLYATSARWDDLEKILKQAHISVPDNLSPDYHAARVILTSDAAPQLTRAEQYLRGYLAQPAEGEEPTHAAAHWRLGLVLEKMGRKDDALKEIQSAVRQDGSLEDAKKDLKRLS